MPPKNSLEQFLPKTGQLEIFGERQVVTPTRKMWRRPVPGRWMSRPAARAVAKVRR